MHLIMSLRISPLRLFCTAVAVVLYCLSILNLSFHTIKSRIYKKNNSRLMKKRFQQRDRERENEAKQEVRHRIIRLIRQQ